MGVAVVTLGSADIDYVAALEGLHGPVTVVRRCVDVAELVAVCRSGIAGAALIAGNTTVITATLSERLSAADVALLALTDDPEEQRRLAVLGVPTARTDLDAGGLADRLLAVAAGRESPGRAGTGGAASGGGAPSATGPGAGAGPGRADDSTRAGAATDAGGERTTRTDGSITAVWGPAGAPGRTTVAVNLAVEAALAGRAVVLVDADTYGASAATFLGLLDESAGVAQACRWADQGLLDGPAVHRAGSDVVVRGARLRVLSGITRADRWAEVRPAALGTVLRTAAGVADLVVVDCGFCLEDDADPGFGSAGPRRNGATLVSLEAADRVIAVGSADAVGVPRLVRALQELAEAVPAAAPEVVFNKVRREAVGRAPERQLEEAWARFGPVTGRPVFLPADPAAADTALLTGSALAEAAPDSALRHGIARLAGSPLRPRRKVLRLAKTTDMNL